MRHNKSGRRLGRKPDHRQHMMRNMLTSMFVNESITTTVTRAKELRRLVDRLITMGKRGDLHARRHAAQLLRDPRVVGKLFERIAPRFAERPGGYCRIIRLPNRPGDNAPMAVLELVEEGYQPKQSAPAETEEEAAATATETA